MMKFRETRIAMGLHIANQSDNEELRFFIVYYLARDIKILNKLIYIVEARGILRTIKNINTDEVTAIIHFGVADVL